MIQASQNEAKKRLREKILDHGSQSRNIETAPGMNHLDPKHLEANRIVFYKKGLFLKN